MRAVTLLVVAGAGLGVACKPSTPATGDIAGVRSAIQALRQAVNARDSSTFYRLTASDFEVFPPAMQPLRGDSARAIFSDIFSAAQVTLDPFSKEELTVTGDLAVQRYSFRLVVTPKGGGRPSTSAGSGLHVWHRDPSGQWRLAKDIWSEPAAPAT